VTVSTIVIVTVTATVTAIVIEVIEEIVPVKRNELEVKMTHTRRDRIETETETEILVTVAARRNVIQVRLDLKQVIEIDEIKTEIVTERGTRKDPTAIGNATGTRTEIVIVIAIETETEIVIESAIRIETEIARIIEIPDLQVTAPGDHPLLKLIVGNKYNY
jgi:hypothetical protein